MDIAALLNIDTALEEGAVFYDHPRRHQVAGKRAGLADLDAINGAHVSLDASLDDDFLGIDIGLHAAIRPHGQVVFAQFDGALHLPVNV